MVSKVRINHFIFYGQLQQSQPLPHVITIVLETFYQCNYLTVFPMLVVLHSLLHAFLSIKTNIVTILHTYYKCLLQHSIDFFNLIKINFYCCFICASLLLFLVSIQNIGFHSDIFPCIMNSAHIPCPIMFSCCPVNDGSPL